MIDGAASMMAANEYEANLNAIEAAIRQAGAIQPRELLRKIRHVNARDRDGIVRHLTEAGIVECVAVTPGRAGGRPTIVYRWLG